jgi:hypothetical protein
MRPSQAIQRKQTRYAKLTKRLARLGYVLQGTIHERRIVLPHPDHPKKERTFGPYYQWTFKREGKSVTVNLTPGRAKLVAQAIRNHRRLEAILQAMRAISREILEATTPGVAQRTSRLQPHP